MDTNTLSPTVAAATLASAHAGNRNLSTDPKRMAVIKVWDAMMRGTLLNSDPREDRKVFATVGFTDFVSAVSVIFSGCCPATVSDSETVFLCAVGSDR